MTSVYDNGGIIGKSLDFRYYSGILEGSSPIYIGGQTSSGGGTSSAVNLTFSLTGGISTIQEGDVVIVAFSLATSTTNRDMTVFGRLSGTNTAEYTEIADLYIDDSYDTNLYVGYKVMGSTPDDGIQLPNGSFSSLSAYTVAIHVWRNVDIDNMIFASATAANSVLSNPPSISPNKYSAIIAIGAGAHSAGTQTYSSSDLSNFITVGANSTADSTLGMGSVLNSTFDPAAFTFSTTDSTSYSWAAVTIAIPYSPSPTIIKPDSGIWNLNAAINTKYNKVPYISDISSNATSTTSASINITCPTDIVSEDLILIFAGNDTISSTAQFDNTTYKPTGFTLLHQITDGSADCSVAAFYKIANGTEGGNTINVPAQSSNYMWASCMVVRDFDIFTPIGSDYTSSSSLTHLIAKPIFNETNESLFFAVLSSDGNDTRPFSVTGDGWNILVDTGSGTATGVGGLVAVKKGKSSNVTVSFNANADGAVGFMFGAGG